jgi:hypothetical protein
MRMHALKTGCAVIGATLGLLGSPVAQADDASFVRNAQALGFVQASDNIISTAQSACYFLLRNRDPQEVEQRIVRYTRIDPPTQAHPFLVLAVNEYCPQYAGLVGG